MAVGNLIGMTGGDDLERLLYRQHGAVSHLAAAHLWQWQATSRPWCT